MKLTFKERYGYPLWYPWAFIALVLTCIGSFIAALATGEWRYLLVTALCYAAVALG